MLSVGTICFEDRFCARGRWFGCHPEGDSSCLLWQLAVESPGQYQVGHCSAFVHKRNTGEKRCDYSLVNKSSKKYNSVVKGF